MQLSPLSNAGVRQKEVIHDELQPIQGDMTVQLEIITSQLRRFHALLFNPPHISEAAQFPFHCG